MKKILFGIMALSMAAFGANPAIPGPNNTEIASVPVTIKAEIISAPAGLTITNEAGTVIDELLIDHGRMIKGQSFGDSVAFTNFKVKRFDNSGTSIDLDTTLTKAGDKLTVSLVSGETGTGVIAAPVALTKDGMTPPTDPTEVGKKQLLATLSLLGAANNSYEHLITAGEKEHLGRVTSRIPMNELNKPNLEYGLFRNNGLASNKTMLRVVYTPGN